MRVSRNYSFQWLNYQNAPYIAYESEEAAPEAIRKHLHKYVFGEKAGEKNGTVEFRFYVDFDCVFLGCVFERGQFGGKIVYTFKDVDDGQLYKMGVDVSGKTRTMLFRIASIARENKVFSLSFNATVSNGEAKFGKYIGVKGENNRPTLPIHQGTYYNGVAFVKNEAVMPNVVQIWNRCCDFHFNPMGETAGVNFTKSEQAKLEFFSTAERVHTWYSSRERQNDFWTIFDKSLDSYIETKVCPLLNLIFSENIQYQSALPPSAPSEPTTEEPLTVPPVANDILNENQMQSVINIQNLDDSGNDLPF